MLERTIDEWAALDVGSLCDSEIRETFLALRRDIDRREAVAARLLAGLHGRGIPAGDGASSTPAWAQTQTGQRFSEARASLDAGQACASLPLTAKAWSQGEISVGAARAICSGRTAGYEDVYATMEADLVDYAASRDFRRLDAMIRYYQSRVDALKGVAPSDRNHLHHSRVGNRWVLGGNLDDFDGTVIDTALHAAIDKPGEGDTRSLAKRRADAMVRICRFFLDHGDSPLEGGEVPHVSVVVRWDGSRNGINSMEPDLRDHIVRYQPVVVRVEPLAGDHRPRQHPPRRRPRHPPPIEGVTTRVEHPRPGLPVPGMRPKTELVPQPSRRTVGARRRNQARQPRLTLQLPPSPRPQTRLDRDIRRRRIPRHQTRRRAVSDHESIESVTC